MNKTELVEMMASGADISKAAANRALDEFIKGVTGSLSKGHKITLPGFGTFCVSKLKERTGRNPQTGATIKIPARTAAKFKVGKKLKESVNKKK